MKNLKNDKLLIQIACVCCAVVLWVVVMIQINPKQTKDIVNIPVNIKNLEELDKSNLALMNINNGILTVTVKVLGYGDEVSKLSSKDITATIDVLGYEEGTNKVPVDIIGPSSVEIVSCYPKEITCVIEGIISKSLDVSLEHEGTQSPSYYVANGNSNPSSVIIKGPRSIVNSAVKAVATVNIDKAQNIIRKNVPISVIGDKGQLTVEVNPNVVEVNLPVYPTKYVNIKTNIIGEPLDGYKVTDVTVEPKTVRIAAKKDVLDSITELETEALDITDKYHNIMITQNIINDGGFVILDKETSPVVKVTIEKIITKEYIFNLNDVKATNIPDGYKIKKNDEVKYITVKATGVTSIINKLSKSDIELVADLTNAKNGANLVKLSVSSNEETDSLVADVDTIVIDLVAESETGIETDGNASLAE